MKKTDSFWRRLSRTLWGRSAAPAHVGGRRFCRPRLERLESRITPSGNDTLTTALPVTLQNGTAVPTSGAALTAVNQVDLYVVQLQAGDQVAADLSAMNGAGPGDALRVFDVNGKQLAFQENPVGGGDTLLTFDALATGPYYVGVSSNGDYAYDPTASGGGTGGLADGAYTLNLTLTAGAILATENPPNYSVGTAQSIHGDVDASITGQSVLQGTYAIGQTEYYRFTVDQTGGLTATVTPRDGTALLPRLALYDDNGQLLIQSDASPGNVSAELNQHLQPGTYYLGVAAVTDSGGRSGDQSYVLATMFDSGSSPFQPLSVGLGPDGVATGDFNHDGNLDIVTANSGDNTVLVLLGHGDGTFQPAVTYAVTDANGNGIGPNAVAVGDFNGDGNLDIVTANIGDDTVSVLLGNGDGAFQPAVTYAVGNSPFSVAVGDFNGHPDIVTAGDSTAEDSMVSVLLGNGNGTFQPAVTYAEGFSLAFFSVAVGDFNGHPDIVTANAFNGTVSVLLGNGDGTFQSAVTYAVGNYPDSVAVGDFNNDGNSDIVTANIGGNTVSVLLGQGNGQFRTSTAANAIAIRNVPYLQDLTGTLDSNGNPIPDELILDSSGALLFRQGQGAPDQFAPPKIINPGHPARDATVFQTADGWAVAAVDEAGNTVSIYTWNAATASFERTAGFATGNLPVCIAAADLTGDGLDDLVVSNEFDDSVTIAFQTPDGAFGNLITRAVGVGPSDIAFANLGGSKAPDILVSDQASGDVTVLFNDSTPSSLPTFSRQSRYRAGAGPFDIDDSTGTQTVLSELQTVGLAVGDFTGPGNDDVVVLNRGAKSFTLLPNQGQGSFANPQSGNTYFPTSDQAAQIAALTLPGDARPSVAVLMEDLSQIGCGRAPPGIYAAFLGLLGSESCKVSPYGRGLASR